MKTLARILIILLAALIVVGVTVAVTNSPSTVQSPQIQDGNFVPGQRPEGGRSRDHDGGSALGWLGSLIPIAGIMFMVVVIERLWGKIFKPHAVQVPVQN